VSSGREAMERVLLDYAYGEVDDELTRRDLASAAHAYLAQLEAEVAPLRDGEGRATRAVRAEARCARLEAGVVGDVERPDGPTVSRLWSTAIVQSAAQGTTAEWAFAHLLWAEFILRASEGSKRG